MDIKTLIENALKNGQTQYADGLIQAAHLLGAINTTEYQAYYRQVLGV
jgi:hypothetical protein